MKDYTKEQRSVLITVPVGSRDGKASTEDIPIGEKVFLGAIAKPIQNSLVRLTVKRNGSNEVVRPMDVTWLDGGVGPFEQRAMEIPDTGGSKLDFYINTSQNVTDIPLEVEIIILVYTPKC